MDTKRTQSLLSFPQCQLFRGPKSEKLVTAFLSDKKRSNTSLAPAPQRTKCKAQTNSHAMYKFKTQALEKKKNAKNTQMRVLFA